MTNCLKRRKDSGGQGRAKELKSLQEVKPTDVHRRHVKSCASGSPDSGLPKNQIRTDMIKLSNV